MASSPPTFDPQLVHRLGEHRFAPSGFFVMRTPLLPLAELSEWSAGLKAATAAPEELEAAVEYDRTLLRRRLGEIVARPEVAEAIFLASPDLQERIPHWLKSPESDSGQRVERSLVRYFIRMSGRSTPFGLFAGFTVGRIGSREALSLAPRVAYRRRTRLDMDYLSRLIAGLEREPTVRPHLRFSPNTSLYLGSGRLRYVESRVDGRGRSHHLVAIEPTKYIECVLDVAGRGARVGELVQSLIELDSELDSTHADAFVTQLIDMQVLVSEIGLRVTGPDPLLELCDRLAPILEAAPLLTRLRETQASLSAFDRRLFGTAAEVYRAFATGLEGLPAAVELKTLVQVDLFKPAADASLGPNVVNEIARGMEILYRLGRQPVQGVLKRFAKEFRDRYEDAEVPLVEALDDEIGIGFMRSNTPLAEGSPLLADMPLGGGPPDESVPWGSRESMILDRYARSIAAGGEPIEITRDDLRDFSLAGRPPLPDSISVVATVIAKSQAAVANGEFQVRLHGIVGPSGARLLGRFSDLSEELEAAIEAHLRSEEAHRSDAIFAEVVHLPDGRIGNILFRSPLRPYEIPFLARAGVAEDHCVPITDLMIRVSGERIVLSSRRLGREIIPRLSNAHNYNGAKLGIYRLLGNLQSQGVFQGAFWSWGPLENAPYLPRVVSGRLIFSLARWQLRAKEIEDLTSHAGVLGYAALQAWRAKRGVPRWVELVEGDNTLVLDLENALSVDVLLHEIRPRPFAILRESLTDVGAQLAEGPEGGYCHELVIPFDRVREPLAEPTRDQPAPGRRRAALDGTPAASPLPVMTGRFTPGSEWLFAKIYCGTSDAEGFLRYHVAQVTSEMIGSGAAKQWFFLRYADPDWHLRIRFSGQPERLTSEVLPALRQRLAQKLRDGGVWRLVIDTYDREIERYGGWLAIESVESYFEFDSEAVLSIIRQLDADRDSDARWRLALLGADSLMNDFGLDASEKLRILGASRASLWEEFDGSKALTVRLGDRYRKERKEILRLLDPRTELSGLLSVGREQFAARRERSAAVVARLRDLEKDGALNRPLGDIAFSLVHMHVNRMMRSAARAHELVVYDFLCRTYESALASARGPNAHGKARVDSGVE